MSEMFKHKHAEAMALYAEDALKSKTPWVYWEYISDNARYEVWTPLAEHPKWADHVKYRRRSVEKVSEDEYYPAGTIFNERYILVKLDYNRTYLAYTRTGGLAADEFIFPSTQRIAVDGAPLYNKKYIEKMMGESIDSAKLLYMGGIIDCPPVRG